MTIYFNNRILSAMEWEMLDALAATQPARHSYCYIDPTGMNPVYDRNGVFLGCTSEGFTDEVLVMRDGYAGDIDVSKMSAEELINNSYAFTLDEFKQYEIPLSEEAYSNIWTNIVSHFNGMHVYDCVFDVSKIQDNRIGFETNSEAHWTTSYFIGHYPIINGAGNNQSDYESTVENIASSLIVHEWYSHGIKHNGDLMMSHRLAYKNVINLTPLWEKTTLKYKKFILNQLREYTKKETGRSIVDKQYRNQFKKYCK